MADKLATTTAYAASGSAIIFGLSANEFAAVVGASVALMTFIVNIWFKYQHLQLARSRAAEGDDDSDGLE